MTWAYEGAAWASDSQSGNSPQMTDTFEIPVPAEAATGSLLVAFLYAPGPAFLNNPPAGWVHFYAQSGLPNGRSNLHAWYKFFDGETSLALTADASVATCWVGTIASMGSVPDPRAFSSNATFPIYRTDQTDLYCRTFTATPESVPAYSGLGFCAVGNMCDVYHGAVLHYGTTVTEITSPTATRVSLHYQDGCPNPTYSFRSGSLAASLFTHDPTTGSYVVELDADPVGPEPHESDGMLSNIGWAQLNERDVEGSSAQYGWGVYIG